MNAVAAGMPLKISATIGKSKLSFLIDTGSTISLIPNDSVKYCNLRPTGLALTNPSGTNIKCYELDAHISISSIRRSFQWTFVIADVVQTNLGLDFLSNYFLLIDCSNNTLVDSVAQAKVN